MNDERDDMLLKRQLDALPKEITPPVDLWPGVRGRIAGGTKRTLPMPRVNLVRLAALLALLGISSGALMVQRHNARTWRMGWGHQGRIVPVDSTITGGVLQVGNIGHVTLPNASVRILRASITEQRMALLRGTMHAEISAPPRLFIVETPSGTVVDLGCAYTMTVDSLGNTTITVTAGWVSFERGSVHSLIPAGMTAIARKGATFIGTPVRDGAPDELRAAVRAYDAAPSDSSLGTVLGAAARADAVALWHLVQRSEGAARSRVVTKLIALAPLPDGVTRDAIERADPIAMELYWTTLPGTLPIIPSWQQKLWKLWLKVGG